MRYAKPALTIADSVLRLQNKGLQIQNQQETERFLRAVGYFRFRGYALPFMRQAPAGFAFGTRQFQPGTTFEQVRDLYNFDRVLRGLVMEQMDRIEVAVRTVILQELNAQFGPHWYLDFTRQVFKERDEQVKWFNDVAREVQRSKEQLFIKHYFAQYTDPLLPPSWAVAECLSFGKWSKLYKELQHAKSAIASALGLSAPILESWLHSLNVLRNSCAHHSRIWNRKLPFPPKAHPRYAAHFADPSKFYARAAAIRIMANHIDGNPYFADGLRYLLASNPGVNLGTMGFAPGWEQDPLWK